VWTALRASAQAAMVGDLYRPLPRVDEATVLPARRLGAARLRLLPKTKCERLIRDAPPFHALTCTRLVSGLLCGVAVSSVHGCAIMQRHAQNEMGIGCISPRWIRCPATQLPRRRARRLRAIHQALLTRCICGGLLAALQRSAPSLTWDPSPSSKCVAAGSR